MIIFYLGTLDHLNIANWIVFVESGIHNQESVFQMPKVSLVDMQYPEFMVQLPEIR